MVLATAGIVFLFSAFFHAVVLRGQQRIVSELTNVQIQQGQQVRLIEQLLQPTATPSATPSPTRIPTKRVQPSPTLPAPQE